MAHEIRALDVHSIDQVKTLIEQDPVRHCFLAARIEQTKQSRFRPSYPDLLGYFDDGKLKSLLMTGANIVPVNTSLIARQEFATALNRAGRRSSSIVGPAEEVLDLWNKVSDHWGSAREIRASQPVMAIRTNSNKAIDHEVRYSNLADLDDLLPACIAMFTEEVGISPTANGGASAYRNRISELVSARRSFVKYVGSELIFKAEVGTVGAGVAQIQGVWVKPEFRGQGISVPAMAAVVKLILADTAPVVSLYVNDFNEVALNTYRSVGFEHVDTFATILF
ncbi:MAG: GNAT family N-acetyltransferase [Actinobacteria bacterium]|nr:GNAT family N-acetyltransferase [Actinomycetota bacterium]